MRERKGWALPHMHTDAHSTQHWSASGDWGWLSFSVADISHATVYSNTGQTSSQVCMGMTATPSSSTLFSPPHPSPSLPSSSPYPPAPPCPSPPLPLMCSCQYDVVPEEDRNLQQ